MFGHHTNINKLYPAVSSKNFAGIIITWYKELFPGSEIKQVDNTPGHIKLGKALKQGSMLKAKARELTSCYGASL